MARPAPTARSSALRILNSVLGEGRLMSEVLGTGLLDPLSAPDRARAQRLANDTLRGMERADRLLNRHLRKQPPLSVRNVLRLATVEICADKWKTHQFLTEHQIPTPRTRLLSHNFTDRESPWKADHRLIVKPRWGAGSQGVAMLTGAEAIHKREQPDADKYLVQAWTSGIPASIAVSQSSHGRLIFPLMKQCLKPKTFEFVSCEGPLPDDMQKRAERLLNRIVTHLPEFSGYLGVDLLLGSAGDGSEDRVIEINPRFTTSFCVTRKLVKRNLFTDLLFPDRLSDRHSPPQHQETNP